MKITFINIKEHGVIVLGFVGILCFLWLVATSSRGVSITKQFFDPIRTTSVRNEVVIVSIDDSSLQALGAWPWDRSVFSKLVQKINQAGAKVAVFDVLFLESRTGDTSFKEALAQTATPIVLAAKLDNARYRPSYFVDGVNPLVIASLANVEPDSDGKVRSFPSSSLQNTLCVSGLAQTAFNVFTFNKKSSCTGIKLGMFRYATQVTTYPLIDIISGKVNAEVLEGKAVFIGSTSLDLLDHFVGMTGEKIPGIFVHASIFTSLLNEEYDRDCTSGEILVLILFSMFATVYLLYAMRSLLAQIFAVTLLLTASVVFSLIAFSHGVEAPLPWLILTIFLTGGYLTLFRFIKERKQGEYISSLFSKYVHKDILKELLKSPSALNLQGEKRDMTILFSDLRGFTSLSELLEPEELTALLNEYFSVMAPCILEEKGTIDKFIGDAIMAFWNAPLFVENHSTHAVRTALRMQNSLDIFNTNHTHALSMGVGIHRGEVIVGNVGSKERVNYTALGDSVNLASRIEGLTKKYGVQCIVTEKVRESVHDEDIMFRRLDVITVSGKKIITTLYEVRFFDSAEVQLFKEYEKAFDAYQSKLFTEAGAMFKELVEQGDVPSRIMLERISVVQHEEGWEGFWHWDEK